MSEVKRYDLVGDMDGNCNINEARMGLSDDGVYVKHCDYEVLQAKCEALAAENARLKSAVTQQIELRAEIKKAGRPPHADFWVQSICEAEEKVKRALEETQATDAFLAEVRAQGVDSAISRVIAMMNHQHPVTSKAIDIMRVHAYQLRKGEWQK